MLVLISGKCLSLTQLGLIKSRLLMFFTSRNPKSQLASSIARRSITAPFWHWVYYLKRCMSIKCHVQSFTSRLILAVFELLHFKENSGIKVLKVIQFGCNQKKSHAWKFVFVDRKIYLEYRFGAKSILGRLILKEICLNSERFEKSKYQLVTALNRSNNWILRKRSYYYYYFFHWNNFKICSTSKKNKN